MPANSYTATTDLSKVYRYIRSVTVTETSGSAAVRWQFRNGADSTNDQVIFAVGAPASGSEPFTPAKPIYFPKGVRLELVTGAGRLLIDGY